ncbi:Helicase required for RNAi-mediated heterochromatin assembly 1 [Gracilariopsis chorda]|uniref:Helicase required for RNAi-mediated heterochromatin assembly 1 n=1 Tax=Gracilariopsis chorda TaxID=448386 RepID=A0A2V3IWS0_9FLOR|nr:Helicase required for RNAi-mediated heterochromatin assembly 1 [Gracilariopsis chorda]|eukprot:PXF46515.1 Helicase required for RNAi-mediated heterochromatin assembly 1 [Gracilariopsis chorda]
MQTPKKSPGNRRSFATPASPSSPHRTPASFSTLLKKEFRHQHDMRKLLIAALTDTNKDAIVRLLASPRGLKQLSHILSCAFTLDAGATSHLVSFQSVAVPLCCLLSHPDIRHSVRVSDISTVYECLLRHRTFFLRYVNLLDEVFHTREGQIFDKRLRSVDLTYYQPSSSIDCAVPFLSMCYAVVQTVYQARSDAIWEDILPGILDYVHKYITGCNDTSKQAQELLRLIDRLTEICSAKSKYLKSPNTDKNSLEGNVASEAEIEAFMNEGPGSFRQNGPRHDNDAADFRQIQVVPNQSEIACLLSPYLPFQSGRLAGASNSWMDDDVDRHLDIQFRLTREDMIAPLRKAIHHFFQSNILGTTSKKHHFKFYDDHRSQGGSCLLLRNVEVAGLSASHVNGTLVRLEFDQIFPANKESERQTSWDYGYGYHLLQSKSIVCIALNVQYVENKNNLEGCPDALRQPITRERDDERNHIDLGGARLVFAFVHYEGRNQLGKSKDRCTTLHVQPVAQDDTFFLMEMLSRRKKTEQSNTTNVILQVRGHFVAGSIPVLHSLQRSRLKELPWAVKLTDRNLLRDKSTNKDQVSVEASPAFASYISPSTRYDLSFLAKDSAELPPEFKNVALVDYNGVMKLLHNNKKEISLDESQIESFVSGLSHEIAMIQGPPGCGKTYIGVKIIQALLNNSAGVPDSNWSRSRTGIRPPATPDEDSPSPFLDPILCVCYTNHALDQFLTALLDTGAVGLNDVVRIGSMSKNETLKSRSLEPLARSISGVHRRDIAICRSHCAEAEHRIAELVTSATSTKQRSKAFGKWMQENHAEFCEEVVLSSTLLKHLPIEGNSNTTYQVEAKGEAKIPEVLHSDEVEGNTVLEREQGFQLVGNFATMLESYLCFGDVAERVTRQEKIDKLREEFDKSTASKMKELFDHHERWFSVMNESKNVSKIACLRRARVIGCTTSGAAKYNDLIQALAPAVIICEEAAEVLESHMLASLSSRTKQLILIGDHLQLRPKVSEFRLSRESNRNHDLDISLFERIATNGFLPVSKLCTQRRMHTTISQIPRETLYPYLIDSTTVMNPPACPRGFQTPLFFVTHREHEHDPTNESLTSFKNVHEGEFICALARYVIRQGYEPHQIAILTPYVGQLLLFREILLRERILVHIDEHDLKDLQIAGFNVDGKELSSLTFENTSGNPRDSPASIASEDLRKAKLTSLKECLRLSTVDNFQGEEAEIVLVSTVRCNDRGSVGFLKFRNRVNVMLTRAKHGMYIIGENKKYTKKTQNQVVDYITMRKLKDLGEETEEDSSIIVLPCGHAFTVETLDGILEISIFYRRNSEGKWSTAVGLDELKSLQKGPYDMKERTRPRCPVCKHALYGINRYKRIIAFHDLVTIQRKWVVMAHIRYQSIMNSIDKLWKALREYSESITSIGSTRANSCNRILAIHKQAQNQSKEAESFVKDTEDKGPTTDLYNMEVANALKGENRLDQKSLEEMQPDPLPTFLARESNMKCILLMVRIACYFIEEQQGNDNGNQSSTKEPLKELQGVEKQAIQLKRTEALREKAQKEFHELLRYTASHSYGKRRKEVVKTYASSLYEIFSDLDNIGFSFMPDVSSTTSQKTECAMEVEELGKELSYLKKLASDMMEKLSSIAYRPVSMEEKKMVFHALASDVGTGIAGFGGHYYRCPNGHTYAIADCGGAVIESQCPECGATIGGTHHRLSSGNEVDPEFREIAWVEGRSYG